MALYKVLGQSNPSANTNTTLYTAAGVAGTNFTVVASIWVCNQVSTPDTFRLWFAVAAAGDSASQYIAYDTPIGGNESISFHGITLNGTDLIRIRAGTANLSFSAFGEEL